MEREYFEEFIDLWAAGRLSPAENRVFQGLLRIHPEWRREALRAREMMEIGKSLPLERLLSPAGSENANGTHQGSAPVPTIVPGRISVPDEDLTHKLAAQEGTTGTTTPPDLVPSISSSHHSPDGGRVAGLALLAADPEGRCYYRNEDRHVLVRLVADETGQMIRLGNETCRLEPDGDYPHLMRILRTDGSALGVYVFFSFFQDQGVPDPGVDQ